MEYRDYYATLGVPRTATQADIKKLQAFLDLSMDTFPSRPVALEAATDEDFAVTGG